MLPLLLIAGGLLVTGGIIAAFWDDICKWIEKSCASGEKLSMVSCTELRYI